MSALNADGAPNAGVLAAAKADVGAAGAVPVGAVFPNDDCPKAGCPKVDGPAVDG